MSDNNKIEKVENHIVTGVEFALPDQIKFLTIDTGSGYNSQLNDIIVDYKERKIAEVEERIGDDVFGLVAKTNAGTITDEEKLASLELRNLFMTTGWRMLNISECAGVTRSQNYFAVRSEDEKFSMGDIDTMLDCFGHLMTEQAQGQLKSLAINHFVKKANGRVVEPQGQISTSKTSGGGGSFVENTFMSGRDGGIGI